MVWSRALEGLSPSSTITSPPLRITDATIAALGATPETAFWANVDNGGGNLRAYSDASYTNRLALDVVECDTGSNTLLLFVEPLAAYSTVLSTRTIYLRAEASGGSQPANDALYGRDQTFADFLGAWPLRDLNDHSGNLAAASLGGTTNPTAISSGYSFSNGYIDLGTVPWDDLTECVGVCHFKSDTASVDRGIWAYNNDTSSSSGQISFRQDASAYLSSETSCFQLAIRTEPSQRESLTYSSTNSSTTNETVAALVFENQLLYAFIDGVDDTSSTALFGPNTTLELDPAGVVRLGTGPSARYQGEIYGFYVPDSSANADATSAAYQAIFHNSLLNPGTFWADGGDPDAGGDIELTVADLVVSSSIDSVELTQQNILSIDNLGVGSFFESVSLTQQNNLTVSDLNCSTFIDNVELSSANILIVENLSSLTALDEVGLIQQNIVSVDSLQVNFGLDNIELSQHNVLSIDSLVSQASLDDVTLQTGLFIAVSDLMTATSIDELSLIQAHILLVDDLLTSTGMDEPELISAAMLVPQDMVSSSTIDNLSLTTEQLLEVQNAIVSAAFDNVDLVQSHVLVVSDLAVLTSLGSVNLGGGVYYSDRVCVIRKFDRIVKIH